MGEKGLALKRFAGLLDQEASPQASVDPAL